MENEEEILREILANGTDEETEDPRVTAAIPDLPPAEPAEKASRQDTESHSQWALSGNGRFMPVGATTPKLPSGIYEPFATPGMWGLELLKVASDGIYRLPDMATETVLSEVNKFWDSEPKYRAHNLLYKRGIILWGPPGGGKTVTVKLLMNELVKRDGIVINAYNISLTSMCLKAVRRIEPTRNLIVVLEDLDEIINYNGEAAILSMLDGENNVDNVLHLATTNFIDRLGARIVNRPSRFDRRIMVGMPGEAARRMYLSKTTNKGLSGDILDKWVRDTEAMSIAHLRELVAAVYCLDQSYDDVITRLQEMAKQPKGEAEFKRGDLGFRSKTQQSKGW